MSERPSKDRRQRLDDLLLKRAVEGVDAGEAAEIEDLLDLFPETDPDNWDSAAAAVLLAAMPAPEPMPESLRQRLLRSVPDAGPTPRD